MGVDEAMPRKRKSGNNSVGRAQPCQGWGREFESRFPLQFQVSQCPPESTKIRSLRSFPARWQSGYAADCNSVYAGSIPTRASIISLASKFQTKGQDRPSVHSV